MVFLLKKIFKCKFIFLLSIVLIFLVRLGDLVAPLIVQYTVDTIIGGREHTGYAFIDSLIDAKLLNALVFMIIIALFRALFMYLSRLATSYASETVTKSLRDDYYAHVQEFSFEDLSKRPSGDLIQRAVSDIETIRNFLENSMLPILDVLFLILGALVIMGGMNLKLSLVVGFVTILVMLSSALLYHKLQKSFTLMEEADQKLNVVAEEAISGVRVVKAFGREDYELERFNQANEDLSNNIVRVNELEARHWTATDFFSYVQDASVLVMGLGLVLSGELLLGELLAFYSYVAMIRNPQSNFVRMISQFGRLKVATKRLLEIMNAPSENMEGENLRPEIVGEVEFRNVSFTYPDGSDEVIRSLSFYLEAGRTLGIIGETGSGKSSITYLLQHLYDYEGEIFIDGIELRRIDKKWLRSRIGLIMQEPFLYSRTIGENIAITCAEYREEEIERASDLASIHHHILSFKDSYGTMVGEKGVSLSGGEKQRISMARTLIDEKRRILVLDDSFSALDTKTDREIREKLKELRDQRTKIIISHRLSSIAHADEILFLKDGLLIERGRHEELMKKEGAYYALWMRQNETEEMLPDRKDEVGLCSKL